MDNYTNEKRQTHLNRESALPLYYQLKEYIRDAILKGKYRAGDKLPTEEELCKEYSVSRPVVRQAYDELIKEGLVGRRKGSGTFVKQQADKNSLFKDFISFSFEKNIFNIEDNTKIVKIEKIRDSQISNRLNISEESELLHIIRIVHDTKYPIAMIESYIPCSYFANIENYMLISIEKTIIALLETFYGIHIQKARRTMVPMRITDEEMGFLHGTKNDLVYEIETKYFDLFERIVILEYYTCLTTKMNLTIEINRKQRD